MKAGTKRVLLALFPLLDMGVLVALPMLLTSAIVASFCVVGCVSIVEEGYPRVLMVPCILLTVVYCFPHFVEALVRRLKTRAGHERLDTDAIDPAHAAAERAA